MLGLHYVYEQSRWHRKIITWEKRTTPVIWMTTDCLTVLQYWTISVFVLAPWHTSNLSAILEQRPSPQSATHNLRSYVCRIVHQDTLISTAISTTSFHSSDQCLKLVVIQKFHNGTYCCISIDSIHTWIHSTFREASCRHHTSPSSQHKACVYSLGTKNESPNYSRLAMKQSTGCMLLLQIKCHAYSIFTLQYVDDTISMTWSVNENNCWLCTYLCDYFSNSSIFRRDSLSVTDA